MRNAQLFLGYVLVGGTLVGGCGGGPVASTEAATPAATPVPAATATATLASIPTTPGTGEATAAPPPPAVSATSSSPAPAVSATTSSPPPSKPPTPWKANPGAPRTAEEDPAHPTHITARHILIQYMGAKQASSSIVRTKEQAYVVAQEVLRRAKAGDDFARLALEYSDEPGAGSRGGSLGRFGRGQMVHEFEDAAFALPVGKLSGIVETPFGFHIIERTE
jgi:hypothetical protein